MRLLSKLCSLAFFLSSTFTTFSQVAIGTGATAPNPDTNAVLLLEGNGSQGIIIPKVSSLGAFGKPGMIVYNTATGSVHYFNTAWVQVGSGGAGSQGIQIVGNKVLIGTGTGFSTEFSIANTAPTIQGQILMWDTALNSGAGGWTSSANTTTPTNGQVLRWNGSRWEPGTATPALPLGQIFVGNSSNVATATAPSAIALNNFGAPTADVPFGNRKITNLAAPTLSTDAATKAYVDGITPTTITGTIPQSQVVNLTTDLGTKVTANTLITGATNTKITYDAKGLVTAGTALTATDLPVMTATVGGAVPTPPNNTTTFLRGDGTFATPAGGGTVTNTSVVTANGFSGTVATPSSTPAITIGTSLTGVLRGNGTGLVVATGADLPAMTATVGGAVPTPPNNTTTFLRGDGTFATPAGGGTVTNVTATGPINVANGSSTPALTLSPLVDADISATAGIAGTKINPAFGTQNITTTTGSASIGGGLNVGLANGFTINNAGNITKINGATTSFPATNAAGVLTNDGTGTLTWAVAGGTGTVTSVTAGTGLTGGAITTSGTLSVDVGTTANKIVQLDATGKLPAVDGSQLTGLAGGGDITGVTAGTGLTGGAASGNATLNVDVGTTANKIVQLDATGKLPVIDGSQLTNLPAGAETDPTVKAINGLVKSNGTTISAATAGTDYLTPTGSAAGLTGITAAQIPNLDAAKITTGTLSTARLDVGTTANKIVQLDATGKLPVIDGSQLTNLPAGAETDPTVKAINGLVKSNGTTISAAAAGTDYLVPTGNGSGLTNLNATNISTGTLATSRLDVGTGANQLVQLDATGKLPAVDGSQLTGLAGGGDITGVTAGTGLTGGAASGNATLNVDVGTTANKIVQLDATGKLPIIDGSQLTNLPAGAETDPTVKAINGLVKSNGTTISAATAGTDYLTPTGSAAGLTGITAAQIPNLDAAKITTGTLSTARIDVGTTANKIVQLDATGKLPVIDGSQLTNLPAGAETDPTVKAINGLVKSNGTTISAATAGTDYLTPTGSAAGLTGLLPAQIPSLDASKITSGTLPVANGGTGLATFGTGGILYSTGTTNLGTVGNGTAGQMLLITGTTPTWQTMGGDATMTGTGTVTIANNAITDAKVAAAAAIAGTKITPNFGAQNVVTTGTLTTGTAGAFAVDATGNITKIRNVTTSFPAANAAGVLTNDGTGTLTWAAGSGWGLTGNALAGGEKLGSTNGNPLTFVTNNVTRMTIDPTGKVGIGTISPTQGLTVQSGLNIDAADANTGAITANGLTFGTTSGEGISSKRTTGVNQFGLDFYTNTTQRMSITQAGNVGIGTNNPASKLDLTGDLRLAQITAPATTTDKLYNVGGSLFWNGTNISSGGSGWALGGNTGTIDGVPGTGTNYIGTRDNVPLNFMVNNTRSGRIDPTVFSTFFGFSSGQNNAGISNTGIGNFSLAQNSTGTNNTALGTSSLANLGTGDYNTGVGGGALFNHLSGSSNTAMGYGALSNSINASWNTAVGKDALWFTTGQNNTALGGSSGVTNTTGNNNTFLGYQADATANNLTNATAMGYNAKVGASNSLVLGGTGVDAVNVGIGTATPLSRFHLKQSLQVNDVLTDGGSGFFGAGLMFENSGTTDSYYVGYGNGGYFRIGSKSAANVFTGMVYASPTGVGIFSPVPTEKLDVTGNIKFSGALMPNNLPGTAGQVLTSAGAGLPPTWTTPGGGGNMLAANNLSELTNFATARTNLGLGSLATLSTVGSAQITDGTIDNIDIANVDASKITTGTLPVARGGSGLGTTPFNGQLLIGNGTGYSLATLTQGSGVTITNGAGTITIASSGMTNPLTTNGDIIYGVGSTPTRLAAGTGFLRGGAVPSYSSINLATTDVTGTLPIANGGTGATTAPLARTALGLGTLATLSAVTTTEITDGTIADADISGSAAIGGTKVVPNFGAQNISTTGTLTTGTTGQFAINATGNITKINNITTSFPSTQGAASTVLTNDGTGTLTWATASSGWGLTGNAGTVDGTNFIGTTDNIPFSIKVNNQKAGRIDHLLFNTFWGYQSGNVNTGSNNTASGYQAMLANTSGSDNTATGFGALKSNTTASGNSAYGSFALNANISGTNNTAVGVGTLQFSSTANFNSAFGYVALRQNTSGANNTAAGNQALQFNTTGSGNSAIGSLALTANLVGNANTAGGYNALGSNLASQNTAFGNIALSANTSGANNTATGYQALQLNTTGAGNAAFGSGALLNNNGTNNVALGFSALATNATGNNNTAVGALSNVASGALTNATAIGANASVTASNTIQLGDAAVTTVNVGTGTTAKLVAGQLQITGGTLAAGRVLTSDVSGNATWQPASGGSALINNIGTRNLFAGSTVPTVGADNAIFGELAGNANTGSYNVIMGSTAAFPKTTGDLNVIIGWNAGRFGTFQQGNTYVGAESGNSSGASTLATLNSFFGERSGYGNTTGSTNTFIGDRAGQTNTTGSDNTALGGYADVGSVALSNATAIGSKAQVNQSNSLVLGSINGVNGATATTSVGIGTTTPVQRLHINEPSTTQVYMRITNAAATNGINIGLGGAGSQEAFIANNQNSPMYFQTNATNRMVIDASGNVGVGTINPNGFSGRMLHLSGTGNTAYILEKTDATARKWGMVTGGGGEYVIQDMTGAVNAFFMQPGVVTAQLYMKAGGFTGINNSNPLAPLDVAATSNIFLSTGPNVFFNSLQGGTLSTGLNPTPSVAVRATGAFLSIGTGEAAGYYVQSDERIKRKVGVSDSRNDLSTLMKLKITDYKYTDSLNAGNIQVKGVFAQEVEKIYPQAISKQTNWIPNIYALANHVEFDDAKQTLRVTMAKPHNLMVGDKVKLISSTSGEKPSVVASVDGNTFTVSNWTEKCEKIFVFGKEVNDFRIVDYDRLFTLNLSATQELVKMLDEQKKLIDELKAKEEESKKKIAVLEASLNKVAAGETELNNLKSEIEKIKAALGLSVEATVKKTEEKTEVRKEK